MATTTNYGWTTPDDTALVKDGASAIRTLGSSIDTTTKNLNPSTTLGDIEYRSSTANTNTRLAIGTAGQVLTVSGGVPAWTTLASGSTFAGASLQNSTNQSIADSTYVNLSWDTETYDTDAYHSTSTNTDRITIPSGKAGYYLFRGSVRWNAYASGTLLLTDLMKNGGLAAYGRFWSASSNQGEIDWAQGRIIYGAVGDYFQLRVYQNSGTSRTIESGIYSYFQCAYLGA